MSIFNDEFSNLENNDGDKKKVTDETVRIVNPTNLTPEQKEKLNNTSRLSTEELEALFGTGAPIVNGKPVKRPKINSKPQTNDPINDWTTKFSNSSEGINSTNHKKGGFIFLTILISLILGLCGGLGGAYFFNEYYQGDGSISINSKAVNDVAVAVAKKCLSGVVSISVSRKVTTTNWLGKKVEGEESALGTGFVVDHDGYILTNSHVVLDGKAETITVGFSDNTKEKGKIIYFDAQLDLAVIKIDTDKDLNVLELADSEKINVGQFAVAIGNPEGLEFSGTVTQGIVSGLDRTIVIGDEDSSTKMENLIQVDAAINGGNSGGPLLNKEGKVIGINSAKAGISSSGYPLEGMGFAIPINMAKPIVRSIKENGSYKRPTIGISYVPLQEAIDSKEISAKNTPATYGIYVLSVTKGKPAYVAGIKVGDIITTANDEKIETGSDLINIIMDVGSGEDLIIEIYRGKTKHTITIKI